MGPHSEKLDRLSVIEYVNLFPADRRNEIRRQIDLFVKKHGKYPRVKFHSVMVQLEEKMTSRQRRLVEDIGICRQCKMRDHERCQKIMGGLKGGAAYCTCQCGGETSLGAPGGFPKASKKIRKEFKKFPEIEPHDPLGNIF